MLFDKSDPFIDVPGNAANVIAVIGKNRFEHIGDQKIILRDQNLFHGFFLELFVIVVAWLSIIPGLCNRNDIDCRLQ